MRKLTIGIFTYRSEAEDAINHIYDKLGVDKKEISYLYRDDEGNMKKIENAKSSTSSGAGAKSGAAVGVTVGALAGIATVAGIIPVIGPLFVAGPLVAALGLTGAAATTVAGAVAGGVTGTIVGALVGLGVERKAAEVYSDRVANGDTLVSVYSDKSDEVAEVMKEYGAEEVNIYESR